MTRIAVLLLLVLAGAPSVRAARGDDPFRLFSVRLHARDLSGSPVTEARIYAFNAERTMFGAETHDHLQPAGVTDDSGGIVLRVPDGAWKILGVGKTAAGRAWLVTTTIDIASGSPVDIPLEPKRAVRVGGRGFNKNETLELDLWVRPSVWPRWWMPAWLPSPLHEIRRDDRTVEASLEDDVEVWLHARAAIDRVRPLSRVALGPKDKSLVLSPPGKDAGTIRVHPPAKRKSKEIKTDVFFVLESLDLHAKHPFLYYMRDDEVVLEVPSGDYLVRHYVEWITETGKWHAEFANEHVTLDSRNKVHEYRTSDHFDVRPNFEVFRPDHAQLWLDAMDAEGNRLDWFVAPYDAPYATLRVFDEEGKLTSELDVAHTKLFFSPRGDAPLFPTQGSFELEGDFELWKLAPVKGEFEERRREDLPRVELPHLTVVYPRGVTDESAAWLEERAHLVAPTLEKMLVEAYRWYDVEPVTGVIVEFHLCSPTAGGSAGRTIILSLDYLLRGGTRTARTWKTYAHELGHSMHVIEPLGVFLQRSDRDHIGLYNESQASFMGSKGAAVAFADTDLLDGVAFAAHGFLRNLRGEKERIGDAKSRLAYLCTHLERELGEEFSRTYFRLAHLEPRDVRNRIRDRAWTPTEKVTALFSIAAERDLGDVFRSAGFEVRRGVGAEALKLATE